MTKDQMSVLKMCALILAVIIVLGIIYVLKFNPSIFAYQQY